MLLAPLMPVAGLEGGADGGPDGTVGAPIPVAGPVLAFIAGEELRDGC